MYIILPYLTLYYTIHTYAYTCSPGYISDKERCVDLLALLLASYDRTRLTLAWAVLELARHPEAVARIQVGYMYTCIYYNLYIYVII